MPKILGSKATLSDGTGKGELTERSTYDHGRISRALARLPPYKGFFARWRQLARGAEVTVLKKVSRRNVAVAHSMAASPCMSLHVYWNGSRGSSQPVPLLAPGFRPGRSNAPVSGTTARCTALGETFVSIMSSHAHTRRCVACAPVPQARSGRPCREVAPARPASPWPRQRACSDVTGERSCSDAAATPNPGDVRRVSGDMRAAPLLAMAADLGNGRRRRSPPTRRMS